MVINKTKNTLVCSNILARAWFAYALGYIFLRECTKGAYGEKYLVASAFVTYVDSETDFILVGRYYVML